MNENRLASALVKAFTGIVSMIAKEEETHEVYNQFIRGNLGKATGFQWFMIPEDKYNGHLGASRD